MANFQSDESAFNFAFEYLKSINNSLNMCKGYAAAKQYRQWYDWLRIAFREACVKFHDKEIEEFDELFADINQMMQTNDSSNNGQILSKLDFLEIKLRRLIQARGMLLPSKSDPKFAILER